MKRIHILLLSIISVFVSSCFFSDPDRWDEEPASASLYEPVTVSRSELNEGVSITGPREIENSGKIYVKDNYLFVGEKYKGFHVFNNTNPSNPYQIAFIIVPGATDIAIKNDILYLNNAVDLVAATVDYASLTLTVQKRIQNAFPQLISPDGYSFYPEDGQIIVNFNLIQ